MDTNQTLIWIIAIGICVFLGGFVLKKTDLLWRFLLRGAAGGSFIWVVGMVLSMLQVQSPVGLNLWTAGVSAVMGLPGVLMLYVMGIYAVL